MNHYYFHLHSPDGRKIEDEEGGALSSDEEAIAYAVQVIDELKLDGQEDFRGWSIEVREGERIIARRSFENPHRPDGPA
jgi:hypothetical protein